MVVPSKHSKLSSGSFLYPQSNLFLFKSSPISENGKSILDPFSLCEMQYNMQVLVALRPGGMISHHLHGKHFGAIHDHLLSGLFHVSQLDFLLPALRSYSFYPHSIQSILKCTAVRSWHSSLQRPPISFRIQVKRPHKGLVGSPQAVSAPTPRPCLSPLFPVLSLWPPCLLQILCIFLSQGTYSLCLEYASPEIHSVFLPFKTAPEHHMTRRFFPTTWHKTAHY